jgi:hypothetical protein
MSDPHRTDTSRALDAASDSDRDAKIERVIRSRLITLAAASPPAAWDQPRGDGRLP